MKSLVIAMLATGLFAVSGERARADYTVIEMNVIMADKNGDLLISKPEYLLIAIEDFNKLDLNQDNVLSPDEIGDLAKDPEYLDGDTDKSGALSIEEVIAEKLADFEAADTNEDGALNVDEVTVFEEKKSKGE